MDGPSSLPLGGRPLAEKGSLWLNGLNIAIVGTPLLEN